LNQVTPQPCASSERDCAAIRFNGLATQLVGLVREGQDLVALGHDPQVLLEPTLPIPAGWCRFVLEIEGEIHRPPSR
jgi:hypothetical protein